MNIRANTCICAISILLHWPTLVHSQSQFENYLNTQNGTIAYPLSNFENQYRINTKTTEADRVFPAQVSMPFSRSLQKNNTTIAQPRELITLLDHDSPQVGPAIPSTFIGHTNQNGQLEAISWNRQTRQYDFFQVDNYQEGKKPKLTRSNRAVCISCHQGGGPIFPAGPWSESSFNVANRSTSLKAQLRNLQSYLTEELKKSGKTVPDQILQMNVPDSEKDPNALPDFVPKTLSKIEDILKANGVSDTENLLDRNKGAVADFIGLPTDFAIPFDDKVRLANDRLLANNVCKNLCKPSDKKCIAAVGRMMAMSALVEIKSPGSKFDAEIMQKAKSSSSLKTFLKLLEPKADALSLPSSVIPDRFIDLKTGKEKILQVSIADPKLAVESKPANAIDFALLPSTNRVSDEERNKNRTWVANQALKDPWYLTYQSNFERVGSAQLFISPTGGKNQENGILYQFSDQHLERLDPKYPRPKTDELTNPFVADFVLANIRLCFDSTPKNIAKIASLDPEKIDRLSDNEVADLFSGSPNACSVGNNMPDANTDQVQQTTQALLANQLTLQSQKKEMFNAMAAVCSKCHDQSFIPLPFDDPKKFLKFTNGLEGKTPLQMIQAGKMPPPNSPYKIDPDTRERWINLLQQIK